MRSRHRIYFVYALIALTVLGPLLIPGHILTLDMALSPRLPMPEITTSSYLFRLLLYMVNVVLPTEIIEKLLFFTILVASGVGMHRLVQYLQPLKSYESWTVYIAGVLYMINPYTYSRFMAGQYSVLLGYALLPFFARALLRFLDRPGRHNVLILTGWGLAISIVSIHSIGLLVVLGLVASALYAWRYRRRPEQLRRMARFGAAGIASGLALSSYWLIPLIFGTSDTARIVGEFGNGDQATFTTVGGSTIGQLANIVRLQGFWAEARDLYTLPQEILPAWGIVVLLLWALVVLGWRACWRHGVRLKATILLLSALAAAVLASGLAVQIGKWLPLLAGYREPHKFVGLAALFYACLVGIGAAAIMQKRRSSLMSNFIMGSLLLLPVLLTPTMFWGFGGQLRSRDYPNEWAALNDRLSADKTSFNTLFLPWHRYMHFGFADRIIMNPATDFFDKPMIVNTDPQFGKASPDRIDETAAFIDDHILPGAAQRSDLGYRLKKQNVKYVLLAKEVNADDFAYLDDQADLRLIHEDDRLKLFQNNAWGP